MTRLALHRYLPLVVAASLASAAGSISGPIAGYIAEASRPQLRAILGVPGALAFSDPLDLPDGITLVRVAPGQDFALVERGSASPAMLFLKDGVVDHITPIDGAMASADWVAFSPGAGSALLFSASGRLQVLSGFPGAPKVALDVDAATLPETPAMGAVNDDGTLALVASAHSLYSVARDGTAQVVFSGGDIHSVSVLRNGTDAAVADAGAGSVYIVGSAGSAPVARVLASGLDGPGDVFPAWDGKSLFVARPGAGSVSSIDLGTGEVRSVAAGVSTVRLTPLRNHDTFLISAEAREPGWIYYRDGAGERVVFIPAVRMSADETTMRRGGR